MLQISPWFIFEGNDDGGDCLNLAYKSCSDNLLFRWALRGSKNLSEKEMNDVKRAVEKKFSEYYIDYPPIKEYFQELVKSS